MHQVMNQECLIHQDLGCVTEVLSVISLCSVFGQINSIYWLDLFTEM